MLPDPGLVKSLMLLPPIEVVSRDVVEGVLVGGRGESQGV